MVMLARASAFGLAAGVGPLVRHKAGAPLLYRSLATAAPDASASSTATPGSAVGGASMGARSGAAVVDAVFRARLEEHYYNTMLEDMMVLMYDHTSPHAALGAELDADVGSGAPTLRLGPAALAAEGSAGRRAATAAATADAAAAALVPGSRLLTVFSTPLQRLPTQPESEAIPTSVLTIENAVPEIRKRRYRKLMYNPIDYTALPKEVLMRTPPPAPPAPYAPTPARMPLPKQVVLKIWSEAAILNKNLLLSAIMSLQCISGVRASPLFAEKSDAAKRIREGMPLGARVELTGPRMFEFLDKLTQCVLPRIREFKGVQAVGDGKGMMEIVLPETAMGYFPDIEPHFDMFPRLFETSVLISTTGKGDWEAALCLSGFQIPIRAADGEASAAAAAAAAAAAGANKGDPWARVKEAKTRDERIALQKEALASMRSK